MKGPRRSGACTGLHYFFVTSFEGALVFVSFAVVAAAAAGVALSTAGALAFELGFSVSALAAGVMGLVSLASGAFAASGLFSFSVAFAGTGLLTGMVAASLRPLEPLPGL